MVILTVKHFNNSEHNEISKYRIADLRSIGGVFKSTFSDRISKRHFLSVLSYITSYVFL